MYFGSSSEPDGLWKIEIPPYNSSFKPYNIVVTGSQEKILEDVLFGDVILCSGQNNMAFTVDDVVNGDYEAQMANSYPNIRITSGGLEGAMDLSSIQKESSRELLNIELPWSRASNVTVAKPNQQTEWDYYSAVCWFTLRNLYDNLADKVPLGGIVQAVGGTGIQYWSSPAAISNCSSVYERGYDTSENSGFDSCLYFSQIAPYTVGPMQLKQIIWYQGEQNAGVGGPPQIDYYSCALPALINDWRASLHQPSLPFGIVLLAPWQSEAKGQNYTSLAAFAELRLIQIQSSQALKHVFTVSTLDQGDPDTGDMHSPYKQVVGERAGSATLAVAYGANSVQYSGPRALSFVVDEPRRSSHGSSSVGTGSGTAVVGDRPLGERPLVAVSRVVVTFDPMTLYGGSILLNSSAACPPNIRVESCESFAVLTGDCEWVSIESSPMVKELEDGRVIARYLSHRLEGDRLALTLHVHYRGLAEEEELPNDLKHATIVGSRALHADWPVVQLTNGAGLPVDPWYLPQLVSNKCGVSEEGGEGSGGGVALVDEKSSANIGIGR